VIAFVRHGQTAGNRGGQLQGRLDTPLTEDGDAQAARVAQARGVDAAQVAALVERIASPRQLGVLGEPRVRVLDLNLALNRAFGQAAGAK